MTRETKITKYALVGMNLATMPEAIPPEGAFWDQEAIPPEGAFWDQEAIPPEGAFWDQEATPTVRCMFGIKTGAFYRQHVFTQDESILSSLEKFRHSKHKSTQTRGIHV
jgi:hypothetical protein